MSVGIIRPSANVEYMITEMIMQRRHPHKWWVVWYSSENLGSAGMDEFDTFKQAMMWDMENPPHAPYDRSTIIYSGVE